MTERSLAGRTRTWDRFLIGLYLTVALAAAMLAGAEGTWLPVAATLPVAAAAYGYVERRGAAVSVGAANALGIVALAAALVELAVRDIEGRILFGAHLLAYLTWIFLWQRKAARQRWGLIALSLLQVAVGGVLTDAAWFGGALAVFLDRAVWTLATLQLAEAEDRCARSAAETGAASARAVADDPAARRLARPVALTVCGAAAVGGAFFLLIPRFELGRRGFDEVDGPLARSRTTGFSERVKLGSFGQILESGMPVFEVRLRDGLDDAPLDVDRYAAAIGLDEPLFRGLTLTLYSDGEWRGDHDGGPPLPTVHDPAAVRQEYRLQPIGSSALFALPTVHAGRIVGSDDPLRVRWDDGTLFRSRRDGSRAAAPLHYVVYSARTLGEANRLRQVAGGVRIDERRSPPDAALYESLPPGLERLRTIAAQVARPDGQDAPPDERARRLVAYLRDSGRFAYSLAGGMADASLDPVEDFLVNRRAGHCEYFASALALMLRAEGIPSRVVNGFKGGEVNRLTGGFEVQQRHAHSWVEAYLDREWRTLDATPAAARDASVRQHAPRAALLRELAALFRDGWRDYVVQMNLTQQRKVLAPLRDAAVAAHRTAVEDWWPAAKSHAWAFATDPSRWFSWQGGAATFVLLAAAVAAVRIVRVLRRRARRAGGRPSLRRGERVEFYERFRKLCRRQGWTAGPSETPREFAAAVAASLSGRSLPPRLAGLPAELTDGYYRIRFGGEPPSDPQSRDFAARLTELEAALASRR